MDFTLLLRLLGATGLTSLLLPVKSQFLLAVDNEYNDETSDVSSSSLLLPYLDGTLIFLRLLGESKHLSTLSFLLGADAGEPASDRFVIDLDLWRWLIDAGDPPCRALLSGSGGVGDGRRGRSETTSLTSSSPESCCWTQGYRPGRTRKLRSTGAGTDGMRLSTSITWPMWRPLARMRSSWSAWRET